MGADVRDIDWDRNDDVASRPPLSAWAAGVSPFFPAGVVALGRYVPMPQRPWDTYLLGSASAVLFLGFLLAFAGLFGLLFATGRHPSGSPSTRWVSSFGRISLALWALLGLVLNAGLGLLTLWLWAMSCGSRC